MAEHEREWRTRVNAMLDAALDHPNICTIHDIGETDAGQTFMAMAYYRGETLKKKIARGWPTPIGRPRA